MTSVIRIRRCGQGDERALALVGQATFLETFSGVLDGKDIIAHCDKAHNRDLYATWLKEPAYGLWLAETDPGDAPVGYMVISPADLPLPDLSSDDVELKRIYILGKCQGSGTGRRLVQEAVAHAQAISARRLLLGVYANNHSAIGFYERMGFKKVGTRTFNVGSRHYDDSIMAHDLKA
jgi:diamine N-acetyltransferase